MFTNRYFKILLVREFFTFMVSLLFITSCSKEENSRDIEFWTNVNLSASPFEQLLVNGKTVGTFENSVDSASCGNSANLKYTIPTNSINQIFVFDQDGDSIYIGAISLGDFNSGIGIDSTNAISGTSISIDGTSNDICTTIKLIW